MTDKRHQHIFRIVVVLLMLPTSTLGQPGPSIPEPTQPQLFPSEKLFLSRIARRTISDARAQRPMYEPGYVPKRLQSMQREVIIRLRQDGYLLCAGVGASAPIALATRDAALGTFELLQQSKVTDLSRLDRLLMEIEVIGDAVDIPFQGDWTQPRALDAFVDPGIDGLVLLGQQSQHRFAPTELFTNDTTLSASLKKLAQLTHSDPSKVLKTALMRFRSSHWYQPRSGADIVSLSRGLTIIPPEAVTRRKLDEVIESLGAYLVYRQKPDGLFTYQYEPALDRYSDEDNLVRQIGATVAMATHAAWSGKSASLAAANMAIRFHMKGVTNIPGAHQAAFLATADGKHKLGVTALFCQALAVYPQADRFLATREKLINGMLWLQRPSGLFITAFPPAESIAAQDYFPGEALLAMATHYNQHPDERIFDAFNRAIQFYQPFFRERPSPAFVPWQVQAFTQMTQHAQREDYDDYVFELTDWLADKQLTKDNCAWPELWGGIAAYQTGRAGVSTASYLEGFADALSLAKRRGDQVRVDRYERVVRLAARFVMQLQFRKQEAYFVRSLQDTVGGIRTSPTLNLLRIDHVQHALIALMKTRHVLYGSRG